jgi:phosphoribosylanthranilate isomerase
MTWIKICGITSLEDAQTAVDAGADAVGFVFWEKSPRNIDPSKAREIVAQLPDGVEKVGVFVDEVSDTFRIVGHVGLTGMQVHYMRQERSPNREKVDGLGAYTFGDVKLYLAFPAEMLIGFAASLREMDRPWQGASAIFVDSGTAQKPGGTGKTFDWDEMASEIVALGQQVPTVIAGGLTPDNVGEAIRRFKPFGVDVSSGVERAPGKKDPEKIRAFGQAVHAADERLVLHGKTV